MVLFLPIGAIRMIYQGVTGALNHQPDRIEVRSWLMIIVSQFWERQINLAPNSRQSDTRFVYWE